MQTTSPAPVSSPESTPSTGSAGSPPPVQAKKSMLWLWILLSVLGLLIIGGIVAAVFFFMRPASTTTNTANTTTNQTANTSNETTDREDRTTNDAASSDDAEAEYFEGASEVLDLIGEAIESWNDAASAGAEGDFETSNEALEEGLEILDDAMSAYEDLEPTASLERIHELLGDAIAKGQEAMELGIEGNNGDDIDKITESGEAIDDLGGILDEIIAELDEFTGDLSIQSSLIETLEGISEEATASEAE